MKWSVIPAEKNPKKMTVAVLGTALVVVCGFYALSYIGAALMFAVMFFSVGEFFCPTTYEITEKGASSKSVFKKIEVEWKDVRKVYVDKDGLKLSTLGYPTRLEAFRGLYLAYGSADREKIKSLVKQYAGLHNNAHK